MIRPIVVLALLYGASLAVFLGTIVLVEAAEYRAGKAAPPAPRPDPAPEPRVYVLRDRWGMERSRVLATPETAAAGILAALEREGREILERERRAKGAA